MKPAASQQLKYCIADYAFSCDDVHDALSVVEGERLIYHGIDAIDPSWVMVQRIGADGFATPESGVIPHSYIIVEGAEEEEGEEEEEEEGEEVEEAAVEGNVVDGDASVSDEEPVAEDVAPAAEPVVEAPSVDVVAAAVVAAVEEAVEEDAAAPEEKKKKKKKK